MADNALDILILNLQERQFPYFEDEELELLLEQYSDVNEASYEGCLIKAQNDSVSLGPINTPSNEQYWLRRARHFRAKCAKYSKNATGTIRRVDEF